MISVILQSFSIFCGFVRCLSVTPAQQKPVYVSLFLSLTLSSALCPLSLSLSLSLSFSLSLSLSFSVCLSLSFSFSPHPPPPTTHICHSFRKPHTPSLPLLHIKSKPLP